MPIFSGLKKNAVLVLRSVMVPAEVQRLEKRLTGKGFLIKYLMTFHMEHENSWNFFADAI